MYVVYSTWGSHDNYHEVIEGVFDTIGQVSDFKFSYLAKIADHRNVTTDIPFDIISKYIDYTDTDDITDDGVWSKESLQHEWEEMYNYDHIEFLEHFRFDFVKFVKENPKYMGKYFSWINTQRKIIEFNEIKHKEIEINKENFDNLLKKLHIFENSQPPENIGQD